MTKGKDKIKKIELLEKDWLTVLAILELELDRTENKADFIELNEIIRVMKQHIVYC